MYFFLLLQNLNETKGKLSKSLIGSRIGSGIGSNIDKEHYGVFENVMKSLFKPYFVTVLAGSEAKPKIFDRVPRIRIHLTTTLLTQAPFHTLTS